MELYNIKDPSEVVSFEQAVKQGLGRNQGLFFPKDLKPLDDVEGLLELDFVTRSSAILSHLIGDEIAPEQLQDMVASAFDFPAPLVPVSERIQALELFHGPTLAFKDFGGRFMAQCLQQFSDGKPVTILTATSGDTGAAVAHAFFQMPGIQVTVLYPKGRISELQEKLFCTLGENITTVAVESDFDDCQKMVKTAFDDAELRSAVGLNSANSINISRLMAQICYYFEAIAQQPKALRDETVIAVPSGNFGNLTAGLLAKALGMPVKRFIAATNVNDTVPRYLAEGDWEPLPTQATLSNAMDVSQPNNWPRIEELSRTQGWPLSDLGYGRMNDVQTAASLSALAEQGYICEPHGAIAYQQLEDQLQDHEHGIFLCTAHPAKFKDSVEHILQQQISLPEPLADRAELALLSKQMPADFAQLKELLMALPR